MTGNADRKGGSELEPLHKDFYLRHPESSLQCDKYCWGDLEAAHPVLSVRSVEEVTEYRQKMGLQVEAVRGRPAPKPCQSFQETSFPPFVEEVAFELFTDEALPFAVQAQAWPCALSGMDVIGVAPTGSGKTLAFFLPALVHMMAQSPLSKGEGPISVVLAPTRELVMQTLEVAERFLARTSGEDLLRAGAVYGGVDASMHMPSEGPPDEGRWPELLVATPGRLCEMMRKKMVPPERISYIVLDEADLLISPGTWLAQVQGILAHVRPDRQLLLFSATWPREAEETALQLCGDELARIRVEPSVPDIPQEIRLFHGIETPNQHVHKMMPALVSWLQQELQAHEVVLVLCSTPATVRALSSDKDVQQAVQGSVAVLDSNGLPEERQAAYQSFLDGKARVLLTTFALGSRGLDYSHLGAQAGEGTPLALVVLLFEFPRNVKEYTHCIGRCQRPGQRPGRALAFLPETRFWLARELIDFLRACGQPVPEQLTQQVDDDRAFLMQCRQAMLDLRDGKDPSAMCGGQYDSTRNLWILEASLPSYRRKLIHYMSDEFELPHVSFGEHPNRRLHISKLRDALPERFFLEGEDVAIDKLSTNGRIFHARVIDPKIDRRYRTISVQTVDGRIMKQPVDDLRPFLGDE